MTGNETKNAIASASIVPWISVRNGEKAADFYKSAFGASETYRLETPEGIVLKLSIDGAEFWLSGGPEDSGDLGMKPPGEDAVRMILTVKDPDMLFDQALKAGASQVYPIGEDHGWRLGRLVDPFGLHWEIGHPVKTDK